MSQRPSEGIGKRVAFYRQLSGLSARELAERAGMGLTRGVIANIESGRKTDVTVDQLVGMANVLGVPPVVIALPVEQPFRFVRLTDSDSNRRLVRTWLAARIFTGEGLPDDSGLEETVTGASAVAEARWLRVERYLDARASRDFLRSVGKMPEDLERLEVEVPQLERELLQLQVDLTVYTVDDEPVPVEGMEWGP